MSSQLLSATDNDTPMAARAKKTLSSYLTTSWTIALLSTTHAANAVDALQDAMNDKEQKGGQLSAGKKWAQEKLGYFAQVCVRARVSLSLSLESMEIISKT